MHPAILFPQTPRADGMASIGSADTESSATAVRTAFSKARVRPCPGGCRTLKPVANGVFEVEELGLQIAPVRQQMARSEAALRFDVGLAELAGAHDVGNAERIRLVGLVALRRHRGMHMHQL